MITKLLRHAQQPPDKKGMLRHPQATTPAEPAPPPAAKKPHGPWLQLRVGHMWNPNGSGLFRSRLHLNPTRPSTVDENLDKPDSLTPINQAPVPSSLYATWIFASDADDNNLGVTAGWHRDVVVITKGEVTALETMDEITPLAFTWMVGPLAGPVRIPLLGGMIGVGGLELTTGVALMHAQMEFRNRAVQVEENGQLRAQTLSDSTTRLGIPWDAAIYPLYLKFGPIQFKAGLALSGFVDEKEVKNIFRKTGKTDALGVTRFMEGVVSISGEFN